MGDSRKAAYDSEADDYYASDAFKQHKREREEWNALFDKAMKLRCADLTVEELRFLQSIRPAMSPPSFNSPAPFGPEDLVRLRRLAGSVVDKIAGLDEG